MNRAYGPGFHSLDDEDVHLDYNSDWNEDDYDFERREERRMEVDLLSIARPARTRKNQSKFFNNHTAISEAPYMY